jgi:hypothetical protein
MVSLCRLPRVYGCEGVSLPGILPRGSIFFLDNSFFVDAFGVFRSIGARNTCIEQTSRTFEYRLMEHQSTARNRKGRLYAIAGHTWTSMSISTGPNILSKICIENMFPKNNTGGYRSKKGIFIGTTVIPS